MGYLPVVVDAVYMGDYRIKLEFDNGEKRLVDCEPWLKGDRKSTRLNSSH